jgi:hypothetical protein
MPSLAGIRLGRIKIRTIALIAALCLDLGSPAPALALGFVLNDDVQGYWNTTIAAGVAYRNGTPQAQLVGAGNANQFPGAAGAVTVNDDSNLNYPHGSIVSQPVTLVSELSMSYERRFGIFARVRGWYDYALENHGVPHGHVPNSYVPGAALDDSGFYSANQFQNFELLDAYAQGTFDVGQQRLLVRLGKQVINWGETQLYSGINVFNPLDVSWTTRAGAPPLDGGFVPVNRIYASLLTGKGFSVDAFYNLDWARSNLPACGTYYSFSDAGFDPSCNKATPSGSPDQLTLNSGHALPSLYAPDPSKWGQFGLAGTSFVESIGTQVGLYYVRYNSPNPVVSVIPAATPAQLEIQTSYPSGVEAYAISAASGHRNFAYFAQLTEFRGLPVLRNFPTLVQGAVNQQGPYAAAEAASIGTVFPGYILVNVTQLNLGGTLLFSPLRGLYDVSLTAEANFQWAPGLPGTDQERLGRYGNFGTAEYNGSCQGGYNVCQVDGFVTPFAWGYRIRAQASLPQPGIGVIFVPVLYFGQDVQGYSADGVIVQGRITGGVALRAIYLRRLYVEIGGTWFRRSTEFDPLRDRGAYTMAVGLTF